MEILWSSTLERDIVKTKYMYMYSQKLWHLEDNALYSYSESSQSTGILVNCKMNVEHENLKILCSFSDFSHLNTCFKAKFCSVFFVYKSFQLTTQKGSDKAQMVNVI